MRWGMPSTSSTGLAESARRASLRIRSTERPCYTTASMLDGNAERGRIREELKKLVRGVLVAVAFALTFTVVLFAKRKIHASPIIFYEGIEIIAVLGVFGVLVLIALDRRRSGSRWLTSHAVMGILLGMAVSYSFHITLPSLLDRSISMFVLSLLREKPLTRPEVQCNFVQQFVVASGALDKRVMEQVATGNIDEGGGSLHMTDRGRAMDSSWIAMADAFAVRKDFVEVRPVARCEGSVDGNPSTTSRAP
jgi:hypothetical protein